MASSSFLVKGGNLFFGEGWQVLIFLVKVVSSYFLVKGGKFLFFGEG